MTLCSSDLDDLGLDTLRKKIHDSKNSNMPLKRRTRARKAPKDVAALYDVHTIATGIDHRKWRVSEYIRNGRVFKRWVRYRPTRKEYRPVSTIQKHTPSFGVEHSDCVVYDAVELETKTCTRFLDANVLNFVVRDEHTRRYIGLTVTYLEVCLKTIYRMVGNGEQFIVVHTEVGAYILPKRLAMDLVRLVKTDTVRFFSIQYDAMSTHMLLLERTWRVLRKLLPDTELLAKYNVLHGALIQSCTQRVHPADTT